MDSRAKIAHLHRRFGLGITPEELDEAAKLGYERSVEKLLAMEAPEPPAQPSEFFWRDKEEADLGSWRVRCWWVYRMLTTQRPLQEKMALFWHNHFAVSDTKVEDGPMMLDYLQVLESNATGRFIDLLDGVSKNPALMRYLDMNRSVRGNPNENFAREVMELFTLGIGNYTEEDVKEVARAFTGWGYIHTYWETPGNADDKLKDMLRYGRPFSSFAHLPAMHDPAEKTILGKKGSFDGDQVLERLANHEVTAERLAGKLWEFFVYPDPEPKAVERVAKTFQRTKGDIKATLRTIMLSPEFTSEKALRRIVKCPVDLCIPLARQMGVGKALEALRPADAKPTDRIAQKTLDVCGGLSWIMQQQGMALLFPPDVAGWKWNEAWATPDSMAHRFLFRGVLLWGEKGPDDAAKRVHTYLQSKHPTDGEGIANALLELMDIDLDPSRRKLVAKVWNDNGGPKALEKLETVVWLTNQSLGLIMAAPEAHLF